MNTVVLARAGVSTKVSVGLIRGHYLRCRRQRRQRGPRSELLDCVASNLMAKERKGKGGAKAL